MDGLRIHTIRSCSPYVGFFCLFWSFCHIPGTWYGRGIIRRHALFTAIAMPERPPQQAPETTSTQPHGPCTTTTTTHIRAFPLPYHTFSAATRRLTEDPHPILNPARGVVSPGYRADERLKQVGLASVVLPQIARQDDPRMGRLFKLSADLTPTFGQASAGLRVL